MVFILKVLLFLNECGIVLTALAFLAIICLMIRQKINKNKQ